MNNIINIGSNTENKKKEATGAACRRLFEEDEGDNLLAAETSPQFKNI